MKRLMRVLPLIMLVGLINSGCKSDRKEPAPEIEAAIVKAHLSDLCAFMNADRQTFEAKYGKAYIENDPDTGTAERRGRSLRIYTAEDALQCPGLLTVEDLDGRINSFRMTYKDLPASKAFDNLLKSKEQYTAAPFRQAYVTLFDDGLNAYGPSKVYDDEVSFLQAIQDYRKDKTRIRIAYSAENDTYIVIEYDGHKNAFSIRIANRSIRVCPGELDFLPGYNFQRYIDENLFSAVSSGVQPPFQLHFYTARDVDGKEAKLMVRSPQDEIINLAEIGYRDCDFRERRMTILSNPDKYKLGTFVKACLTTSEGKQTDFSNPEEVLKQIKEHDIEEGDHLRVIFTGKNGIRHSCDLVSDGFYIGIDSAPN